MGNISRILAVTTAVLSMAFLGFAGVTTMGGPNWQAITQSDTLKEYRFERSAGENPQWTVMSSRDESLKTSKVLPETIVAALEHKSAGLKVKLDTLTQEQPLLESRKTQMETAIATDKQALVQAVTERTQFLEQMRQQYVALSQQVVQKTEEGQQVEQVIEARRTDVFRLENQLEVLSADDFRVGQIEQQMLDLIRQIDADLEKAIRRQNQLRSRLGEQPVVPYSGPATTDANPGQ